MTDHGQAGPVSLYLHFPFCERKCRYCDFLSGPASEETKEEYVQFLCGEIRLRGALICAPVDTVFFGGGTPSLMTPSQLDRVMASVRDSCRVLPDAEISMEVNPGTADFSKLRAYREAGINRLSIGVQSFDDDELRLLGRIHTKDQAREIFHAAREAGFTNINLDLMSALPGQDPESWSHTLREAVKLGPEHLSAYSLILEEGTPFAAMYDAGELPVLPSEEKDREMYRFTGDFLAENGYRRYEISNYAREGYACKHNCGYWTGHEYLGLGLGASSDFGGERFRNPDAMEEYRKAVAQAECFVKTCICKGASAAKECADSPLRRERQRMTAEDRMEEFMFLGLRMTDGVSECGFTRRFGKTMEEVYGGVIRRQLRQGVIRRYRVDEDHRIALTGYGLDVANHVMAEYLL